MESQMSVHPLHFPPGMSHGTCSCPVNVWPQFHHKHTDECRGSDSVTECVIGVRHFRWQHSHWSFFRWLWTVTPFQSGVFLMGVSVKVSINNGILLSRSSSPTYSLLLLWGGGLRYFQQLKDEGWGQRTSRDTEWTEHNSSFFFPVFTVIRHKDEDPGGRIVCRVQYPSGRIHHLVFFILSSDTVEF